MNQIDAKHIGTTIATIADGMDDAAIITAIMAWMDEHAPDAARAIREAGDDHSTADLFAAMDDIAPDGCIIEIKPGTDAMGIWAEEDIDWDTE